MNSKNLGWFVLVVLCVGLIWSAQSYVNRLPFTSNGKEVIIEFERHPCYGTCPIYSMTIYGSGVVIYDGVSYVDVEGERVKVISQEEMKSLLSVFEKANFYSLDDRYTNGVTDLDSITLTVNIDGRTKKIRHYEIFCGSDSGYDAAPPELCALEQKLEGIVENWVGGSK